MLAVPPLSSVYRFASASPAPLSHLNRRPTCPVSIIVTLAKTVQVELTRKPKVYAWDYLPVAAVASAFPERLGAPTGRGEGRRGFQNELDEARRRQASPCHTTQKYGFRAPVVKPRQARAGCRCSCCWRSRSRSLPVAAGRIIGGTPTRRSTACWIADRAIRAGRCLITRSIPIRSRGWPILTAPTARRCLRTIRRRTC